MERQGIPERRASGRSQILAALLLVLAASPVSAEGFPMPPDDPGIDIGRHTVACIGNETGFPISFEFRWGRGPWWPVVQEPGETTRLALRGYRSSGPELRFMASILGDVPPALRRPARLVEYRVPAARTEPAFCDERIGNFHVFRLNAHGQLDLYRSHE